MAITLRDITSGKNDVRKFLSIGMSDEILEWQSEEHNIPVDVISELLDAASIYVDGDKFNEVVFEAKEPEKVIVPACAEPWLEKAQYSSDVISLFPKVEYATDSDGFIEEKWDWSGEFYDWLANDSDTLYILSDALRYGYEVEKEPLYRVRVNNMFFVSWGDAGVYPTFIINDLVGAEMLAMTFEDKEKAENVAKIVDGKVEESE